MRQALVQGYQTGYARNDVARECAASRSRRKQREASEIRCSELIDLDTVGNAMRTVSVGQDTRAESWHIPGHTACSRLTLTLACCPRYYVYEHLFL